MTWPPRDAYFNKLLQLAHQMADDESSRTTELYDRRNDDISLDEVERIGI